MIVTREHSGISEAERLAHEEANVVATEVAIVANVRMYEETLAATLDSLRGEGGGVTAQAEEQAEEQAVLALEEENEAA